jgi:murein L,D-transpeptidase YcbB/YkuD
MLPTRSFPKKINLCHDTYQEAVFNQKNRGVSHSCIRLKEPTMLVEYLLRQKNDWTKEKLKLL